MTVNTGFTEKGITYPQGGIDRFNPAASMQEMAESIERVLETALGGTVLLDRFYPVGTVFEHTIFSTPAQVAEALGGGTWVPTQQGRVSVGRANSGTFATAGATGGVESVTLTAAQSGLRQHNHGASTASAGAHTHTANSAGGHTHTGTTSENGGHVHGIGIRHNANGNAGVAGTVNTAVTATVNTASAGAHTHTFTTNTAGAHTHSTTENGAHTHPVTVNNVAASNATEAHTNLPPYVVTFKWLRVA